MPTETAQSARELYIAELKADIARLQALLAAVESQGENLSAAAVASGNGGPNFVGSTVRPDSFFGMSVPQATRRYLEMVGKGNPQTPQMIADALIAGGNAKPEERGAVLNNVYTAFRRGPQDFIKVGKFWGLTEWYPNAAKSEPTPKKKGKGRGKKKRARSNRSPAPVGPQLVQGELLTSAPTGGKLVWKEFLSKRLGEGKTMKDASAEWKLIRSAQ